jgi:hypothetical protein
MTRMTKGIFNAYINVSVCCIIAKQHLMNGRLHIDIS